MSPAICAWSLHDEEEGCKEGREEGRRASALPGGGLVGVRASMHESEEPVVRPYFLVNDIEAAVAAAVEAVGDLAHPPMEIPGHGTFAIYIQGGINHGLWQL